MHMLQCNNHCKSVSCTRHCTTIPFTVTALNNHCSHNTADNCIRCTALHCTALDCIPCTVLLLTASPKLYRATPLPLWHRVAQSPQEMGQFLLLTQLARTMLCVVSSWMCLEKQVQFAVCSVHEGS